MTRGWILGLAGFGVAVLIAAGVGFYVLISSASDEFRQGFARGMAESLAGLDTERFVTDRRGFVTTLPHVEVDRSLPPPPPPGRFDLVRYAAPLGPQWAYVTPVRNDGVRRPAVVYVHGGFEWSLGDVWTPNPYENDQSGGAFERPDLVVMHPSLRGSHDNPGRNECFLGEVDDVIAAAEHLAARPDVDPTRIHLVGHSTGGTLALLVAAAPSRFADVVAFGPSSHGDYGDDDCFPEGLAEQELNVRSPIQYVDVIRKPTWIVEGAEYGNTDAIDLMREYFGMAPIQVVIVPGLDHFSVLRPGTEVVADAIVAGTMTIDEAAIRARREAAIGAP
ncbi:MAG: alpha/beta fold hydrolase [Sandaracinus sp.]|nr:alpha/beta fold hydrolase [Sandaracinus sp.]MCB9631260.1 alpha/beta fold hydrolase [Sandaracinus sp.]